MQTEEGATKGGEHTNSHMMQPYSGTILAFPQLFPVCDMYQAYTNLENCCYTCLLVHTSIKEAT